MRYAPIPHVARGPRGIPWNPPPGRAFGSNKRMANAAKRAASFQAHRHARRSTPRPHGPRRRRHPLQPRRERQSGAGQPARPVRGQARAADPRAPGRTQPLIELRGQRARDRRGRDRGRAQRQREPRPDPRPPEAIEQYTDTINDLLDINTEIAPGGNNQRLIEAVRASVALARAKEFADHQRGLLAEVFSRHAFAKGQYGKLTSLRAVEVIYVAQFESAATPQQIDFYRRAVEDPQIRRVENMRDEAVETGGQGRVPGDATTWFQASSVELDRLRGVEQRLSADVVATSVSIKANADHRALLYTLLLLAALALSVGLSLGMARSVIRRLGRLKDVAHEVAERKLPGVVDRLREGESVDLAAESATPIDAYARDEIGQLGEAFSFVHQVAVQLAGREAALRRSVGDMFLNLARRSQSLVERQLELIGDLGARNLGDAMVELSELDHLAGRMRRNAENLIVLSGSEPARRRPTGPADAGGRPRRLRRGPPDGRAAGERPVLLGAGHQGAGRGPGAAARLPDRAVRGPAPGRAAGGGTGQRQGGAAELGRAALRLRRGPARWSGGWPGRRPAPGG